MTQSKSISEFYDAEAASYASKFLHELDNKPYDRYIIPVHLSWFFSVVAFYIVPVLCHTPTSIN